MEISKKKTKIIQIHLDEDLVKEFDRVKKKYNRTRKYIIEAFIREFVKKNSK